jgi:repressor LexA
MTELTERQREVLGFIQSYQRRRGYPPTVSEIGSHFRFGPRAAKEHLDRIEKKGYIRRRKGARAIEFSLEEKLKYEGIPLIGRVAAGVPVISFENLEGYFKVDAETAGGKEIFALRVKGDSMSGSGILDGDLVLVLVKKTADNGDIVVARIRDEATVKEYREEDNFVKLVPHNPEFEVLELPPGEDFEILGKVISLWRDI